MIALALPWPTLAALLALALVTSAIHGATGIGGGFLLAIALAFLIPIEAIVPVLSVTLLLSNVSRSLINLVDFDRRVFLLVAIPAVPCIVVGALVYAGLSGRTIAILLGVVVLASIPLRHVAAARSIHAGPRTLVGAGLVYGSLSGVAVGGGLLLAPFMLGAGIGRRAFVATLAVIALTSNVTRVGVFGASGLLDGTWIGLGVLVGLATVPGNWLGRRFLVRLSDERHGRLVDVLTVFGGVNFFWIASRL